MTDTITRDAIQEALGLIDHGLGEIQHRELLSANEVADLLLDVRLALSVAEAPASDSTDDGDARVVMTSPN
jgi:hypothetical protein